MTKKEFKSRCFFNTYRSTGVKINAIWFDWKAGFGYKFGIWTNVKNAGKEELFNDFYAWVTEKMQQPYYYEYYKFAETDDKRFKVPLSIRG